MANFNPWQQEKPRVVGHQVDVSLSLLRIPPDKPIPTGYMPGGCREGEAAHRPPTGKHHVFPLFSHRMAVAQIMILFDQAVVQLLILSVSDLPYLKGFQLFYRAADPSPVHTYPGRLFPDPCKRIVRCASLLRQPDQSCPVQL